MYREIAKLIMYGDMDKDCILYQMGEIFRRFDEKTGSKSALIKDIYTQLKRLLIVASCEKQSIPSSPAIAERG